MGLKRIVFRGGVASFLSLVFFSTWVYHFPGKPLTAIGLLEEPITSKFEEASPYPTLNKECFRYDNMTAVNVCCRMRLFRNSSDVLQCISPSGGLQGSASKPRTVSWVFFGDSHTRYIFCALFRMLDGKDYEFRMGKSEGPWQSLDYLLSDSQCWKGDGFIEIRHASLPFRMTFYWDKKLTVVPDFVRKWNAGEMEIPDLVMLTTGTHWMLNGVKDYVKKGKEAAGRRLETRMRSIASDLASIADKTLVVFKVQDDIRFMHPKTTSQTYRTPEFIAHLNAIFRRLLRATGVHLWDSTEPLSVLYTEECKRDMRHWPSLWWMCRDSFHIGYSAVQQYANMLLNVVCNKHMPFQETFCHLSALE